MMKLLTKNVKYNLRIKIVPREKIIYRAKLKTICEHKRPGFFRRQLGSPKSDGLTEQFDPNALHRRVSCEEV